MVSIKGSLSKGWLARELHIGFDRDYYFDLDKRYEIDKACNEYALNDLSELSVFYTESNLGRIEFFAENQILVGGIQPNMILGMLLGAEFQANVSADADISQTPLKNKNLDDLPSPKNLVDFELIKLFDEQIDSVRSNGKLVPIPPFFWDSSGRATIHGTLTTALKFLGEEMFTDMIVKPDKVIKLMDWITESFVVLVDHFAERADMPIRSVHVGECSGCMVAPKMFKEFVVPNASRIAEAFGPLRYHSCGPSDHVLELIKTIPHLSHLDFGGDTSISKARELFGQGFPIDVSPMPTDLMADTAESVLNWAKIILEENRGGPLSIIYHLEPNYKIENIQALCEYVKMKQ
jgi:hypothetical protein